MKDAQEGKVSDKSTESEKVRKALLAEDIATKRSLLAAKANREQLLKSVCYSGLNVCI